MSTCGKGSDSEKLREVEPKQSDKVVAMLFFSAQKFVVRVLIRFVDVANVETIYHHELLEYSFSK